MSLMLLFSTASQGTVSGADTATFAEGASAVPILSGADAATLAEGASLVVAAVSGSDAGSVVDAATIGVARTDTDTLTCTAESASVEVVPPTLPSNTPAFTFTDEFAGSGLDATRWRLVAGEASVDGGQLRMVPGATDSIVESVLLYNLRGSELVLRGASEGALVRAAVELAEPSGSLAVMLVNDELTFRINNNGYVSDLSVPYDPAVDVYWRIREAVGQVLFDTSPDGTSGTWVTRRQAKHNLNLTGLRIRLTVAGYAYGSWGHGPWGHTTFGHAPAEGLVPA